MTDKELEQKIHRIYNNKKNANDKESDLDLTDVNHYQVFNETLAQQKNLQNIILSPDSIDTLANNEDEAQQFINALTKADNLKTLIFTDKPNFHAINPSRVIASTRKNRSEMICRILDECKSLEHIYLSYPSHIYEEYDQEHLFSFLQKNKNRIKVVVDDNTINDMRKQLEKELDILKSKSITVEELKKLLSLARSSYLLFKESSDFDDIKNSVENMTTMLCDLIENKKLKLNLKNKKMNEHIKSLLTSDDDLRFEIFLKSILASRIPSNLSFMVSNILNPKTPTERSKKIEEFKQKIKEIIDSGKQNDVIHGSGTTILMMACQIGDIGLIKTILNAKVDVNAVDDGGYSALILAVINLEDKNAAKCIKLLIAHGATIEDVVMLHKKLETALSIAEKQQKKQCIKLLSSEQSNSFDNKEATNNAKSKLENVNKKVASLKNSAMSTVNTFFNYNTPGKAQENSKYSDVKAGNVKSVLSNPNDNKQKEINISSPTNVKHEKGVSLGMPNTISLQQAKANAELAKIVRTNPPPVPPRPTKPPILTNNIIKAEDLNNKVPEFQRLARDMQKSRDKSIYDPKKKRPT